MNSGEQHFCESLLSAGQPQGSLNLVQIVRDGALLMALPKNKKIALAITDLYQPQRWKGRFLRRIMRALIFTGFYGVLPKARIEIGSDGLLERLGVGIRGDFGFLLGGQDSAHRSMIGIYEHQGELCVVKCGFGHASGVIVREYEIMSSFGNRVSCVPRTYTLIKLDNGNAYTCEFVLGRSPRGAADDALVFKELSSWLDQAEVTKVSDVPVWSAMKDKLTDAEYAELSAMGDLDILCPVMHGDFTPWNIKVLNGNKIKILDWEYAEDFGIPGWDAIHYLLQRLMLVEQAAADHAVKECIESLRTNPIARYLTHAGLTGCEHGLLLSYLYYSGRVLQYPRDELISVCRELKANANE